ncbi:hypothetical protein GCM10009828_054740 [Actinoplanes couchii]|uniref:Uncharacterized protein n=2 Tax=Actinoplanes couchii TaxID=403638 RepID=A0ABQ3XRP5_9ACTN|nr:hypothetical protein Aco03nite_095870 [Actinoplanes couchii]
MCRHLIDNPGLAPVRVLTGHRMDYDLSCEVCASGTPVTLTTVCQPCFDLRDDGYFLAWRGEPGIVDRPEPVGAVTDSPLPAGLGPILDFAALPSVGGESRWLLLTESGWLVRFDATAARPDECAVVREHGVAVEEEKARLRLHVSADGRFAAVANDFGRYGAVLDLDTGETTLSLDGGDYHPEQVPFSVAFAVHAGRTVVVHRTAWNRLDVSDAQTGALLTARTTDDSLGYFHGALYVSPNGRWIADDGWVWHPVGSPSVWDLRAWLGGNVGESEDGPSLRSLTSRDYYWNAPMCWIGDDLLAVSGIGPDDVSMLAGVQIFDAASGTGQHTFAGPRSALFASGGRLFAVAPDGLEIWDPTTGDRTGRIPGFSPSRRHPGTAELAEIRDGVLRRWPSLLRQRS